MRKTITATVMALSAFVAASPAAAINVFGIDLSGRLVSFDTATPGTINSTTAISGLIGSAILGLDFRPATGQLYALGGNSTLYTINTATGAATAVGGPIATLSGSNFGFDFNPTVDRIRVVSDSGQNLRLNPVTGALAATDTNLAYAAGDPNAGTTPLVSSVGYTNSVAGATATTLFALDSGLDTLLIINPPNNGTLNTVGALGVDIASDASFDIAPTGSAFFSTGFNFYSVSLATGAASLLGSTAGLRSIAIAPTAAVPEPASWAMMIFGIGAIGTMMRRRSKASVAIA